MADKLGSQEPNSNGVIYHAACQASNKENVCRQLTSYTVESKLRMVVKLDPAGLESATMIGNGV